MEQVIDTGSFDGWTSLVRAAAVVTVAALALSSCTTLLEYVNALFVDFDKADTDKDGGLTFEEIELYSRGGSR